MVIPAYPGRKLWLVSPRRRSTLQGGGEHCLHLDILDLRSSPPMGRPMKSSAWNTPALLRWLHDQASTSLSPLGSP